MSNSSADLWPVACQAPLSIGFTRQEYWSGWPFISPRDLPSPGTESASSALQADCLLLSYQGSPNKGSTMQQYQGKYSQATGPVSAKFKRSMTLQDNGHFFAATILSGSFILKLSCWFFFFTRLLPTSTIGSQKLLLINALNCAGNVHLCYCQDTQWSLQHCNHHFTNEKN